MELLLSGPARRPIAISEFPQVPSSTVRRRRNTAARCDPALVCLEPSHLQILAELATLGERGVTAPWPASCGSPKHTLEHQRAPLGLFEVLRSRVYNTV